MKTFEFSIQFLVFEAHFLHTSSAPQNHPLPSRLENTHTPFLRGKNGQSVLEIQKGQIFLPRCSQDGHRAT